MQAVSTGVVVFLESCDEEVEFDLVDEPEILLVAAIVAFEARVVELREEVRKLCVPDELEVLLVVPEGLDVLPEDVERVVVLDEDDLEDVERLVVVEDDPEDAEELDVSKTVLAGVLVLDVEEVWDEERDVEVEEELSSLM